jgi:hypothetical protein
MGLGKSAMKPLSAAAVLAALLAGLAPANAAEWRPTFLACTFTELAFASHNELAADEEMSVTSSTFQMNFAAIDLANGRAQLAGNAGSADVLAWPGAYGSVVFLERTPVGNVNVTTVLPPSTKDGIIRAIGSRQIVERIIIKGYMASQMLGTCEEHLPQ